MAGSTAELIKEKLDIAEFLKGYLTLQRAGRNFKALCPFHKEKSPSFMISPERQSWHCFGCSLGGDIFAFLMRYENIEFGEALRVLAEKAGVELRRANPLEYKHTGLLYDLQSAAKEFFKKEYARAEAAKKYLAERGLSSETRERFEIGWAPQSPEALTLHLLKSGARPEDTVNAGLAYKNDRGLLRDRFRGRIMFPIHNHFGKAAGFSGRILPQFDTGEMGKYVNSPESPIFQKSKLLYGFWDSKRAIQEARQAILVEGQMDFLMSWQAGVKNAVASSGTALTPEHLRVLKRAADELVIAFDGDEAGLTAGERAIDLAQANDFGVKVLIFKGAKDAAEMAAKDPEALRRFMAAAETSETFYFERYLKGGADARSREGLGKIRAVLAKIRSLSSPILQNAWLKDLAARVGIEERVLMDEMAKGTEAARAEVAAETEKEAVWQKPRTRLELVAAELLAAAYQQNALALVEESARELPPSVARAYEALVAGGKSAGDAEADAVMQGVFFSPPDPREDDIGVLRAELHKEFVKERRANLVRLVKGAEASGDKKALEEALRELQSLEA